MDCGCRWSMDWRILLLRCGNVYSAAVNVILIAPFTTGYIDRVMNSPGFHSIGSILAIPLSPDLSSHFFNLIAPMKSDRHPFVPHIEPDLVSPGLHTGPASTPRTASYSTTNSPSDISASTRSSRAGCLARGTRRMRFPIHDGHLPTRSQSTKLWV